MIKIEKDGKNDIVVSAEINPLNITGKTDKELEVNTLYEAIRLIKLAIRAKNNDDIAEAYVQKKAALDEEAAKLTAMIPTKEAGVFTEIKDRIEAETLAKG